MGVAGIAGIAGRERKVAQCGICIAPENSTFRRQLATAYAMPGRKDEAEPAVGEFLRLEPDHTLAERDGLVTVRAARCLTTTATASGESQFYPWIDSGRTSPAQPNLIDERIFAMCIK